MVRRKIKGLLVVLLASVVVTWFWWHGGSHPAVDPGSEPVSANTPIQPGVEENAPHEQPAIEQANPVVFVANEAVETVLVEGLVKDQQQLGVAGMQVELSMKGPVSTANALYSATTDVAGKFMIESVPPGEQYRLEVLASGGYAGTMLDGFPVTRSMATLNIIVESVELASIEGLFVDSGYGPVAGFEMLVQNVGLAYPGRTIKSDSSGFFQLGQFPAGDLQLSASGRESFRVTGIELKAGEYRNLEIVVDKGNYHLSGWVTSEFDEPLKQARVVMTSDFRGQGYRSTSYRLVVTDGNGNFSFSNIGGMDHRLVVEAVGYQSQSLNHQFELMSDDLVIRLPRI